MWMVALNELAQGVLQPLDLVACPRLGLGCRFLRLDHRTLLANTPRVDVLARLRAGKSDNFEDDLAHVEGLFLRGRTLRFADFTASHLYAVNLLNADLRRASLKDTQLQGTDLRYAHLQGANLNGAQLQWASLYGAQLQWANLNGAQLQWANLNGAQLQGANLNGAQLQGANLNGAHLQGANLDGAQLQGANLDGAQLQGARLRGAQLEGADLQEAQLQGADLRRTRFWLTAVNAETNLGFADFRAVSWQPIDEEDKLGLREIIYSFGVGKDWQQNGKARLERLLDPKPRSGDPPEFALEGALLVDGVTNPRWQRLDHERLTNDEEAYDEALIPFLADLARSDPHVARGLASRIDEELPPDSPTLMEGEESPVDRRAKRLARGLLDRVGLALPPDVRELLWLVRHSRLTPYGRLTPQDP